MSNNSLHQSTTPGGRTVSFLCLGWLLAASGGASASTQPEWRARGENMTVWLEKAGSTRLSETGQVELVF